ncbi:diguanylate cyclase [Shewanella sp. 10N.286.51.B2]|nr:GGDEF domain-containing protein [Shewanella sp. 4_MG-2023]MDO6678222.1 GGDEF domain-containing protein [Shewanella sp. 4_MG-2023]
MIGKHNKMSGNDYFLFFLESSSDFIYFKDSDFRFTYASRPFLDLLQIKNLEDIIGKSDFDLFDEEHAAHYRQVDKDILAGKVIDSLQETYFDQHGKLCWISTSKTPIFNDSNEIIGMFGISRDITRIKELEAETTKLAQTDNLTGLCNRNSFLQQSRYTLNLAQRSGSHAYLFFIDVDRFKGINDTYGHPCGDAILKEIASRLQLSCRKSDCIARYGGDEFLILVTENDSLGIQTLARKIHELNSETITYEQTTFNLSCSIGVAKFPTDAENAEGLIKVADDLMYEAKKLGKNRTVFSPQIVFTSNDN